MTEETLLATPPPATSAGEPPPSVTTVSVTVTEKQTPLSLSAAVAAEQESEEGGSTPPPPPPGEPESVKVEFATKGNDSPARVEIIESENPKEIYSQKIPESLVSFKEESNRVSDLSNLEKKALDELKQLVQEALNNHQFTTPAATQEKSALSTKPTSNIPATTPETGAPTTEPQNFEEAPPTHDAKDDEKQSPKITSSPEEVLIWGVPLLKDDRSDVILLKFLRARDFKVSEALAMIKGTVQWRKEFGIDSLIDEYLGDDLEKVVFMHGFDKEGHTVCYNVYGEFQNKELYQKSFSDEEKRMRFLRWRIQFLERSIRKLDFSPGGICTIFQISDLKNSPGAGKKELRQTTKQALQLLQDNYPEFVAKQVFINVPWWYLAFYTVLSPFLTQRTKSKFVFAGPSKTAETLFKYIPPEQVPIQYGGLSVDFCECNPEFTIDDPATEIIVKPATKQTVEIFVNEKCILVWELRVVGWEVRYSAEYVPSVEGGYTINIQKGRKMSSTDEPVVTDSFKIRELGKILINIDNPTSKKKLLVYRFRVKPLCD